MKIYETYGTTLDLEKARKEIELLCSLKFKEHDSYYYGIYYMNGDKYKGESYQLIHNIDSFDNEPVEKTGFPVILYINNITSDNNMAISRSKDFIFISREIIQ